MFPEYLTSFSWVLLVAGAFITGFAKAGLNAVFIVVVPMYAAIFAGKVSASVVLPLMLFGDIIAIITYHKK